MAQFLGRNFLLDAWFRVRRAPSWRAVRATASVARRKQESLVFCRGRGPRTPAVPGCCARCARRFTPPPRRGAIALVPFACTGRKGSVASLPAARPCPRLRFGLGALAPSALRLGGCGWVGLLALVPAGAPSAGSARPVARGVALVRCSASLGGCPVVARSLVVSRGAAVLAAPWWRRLVGSALAAGAVGVGYSASSPTGNSNRCRVAALVGMKFISSGSSSRAAGSASGHSFACQH